MKLIGMLKRCAAGLCAAVILAGGVPALALDPASAAPAELETTNASAAALNTTLSKFNVTYVEQADGWRLDSPYESASDEAHSCGVYPYLDISNADSTIAIELGMTYSGTRKLDMKTVSVETEDAVYTFNCDDQFGGGYDQKNGIWFDFEIFDMDEDVDWMREWLKAKNVMATFIGRDGTRQDYPLTKDNLTAIREVLDAYDQILSSDASTVKAALRSAAK